MSKIVKQQLKLCDLKTCFKQQQIHQSKQILRGKRTFVQNIFQKTENLRENINLQLIAFQRYMLMFQMENFIIQIEKKKMKIYILGGLTCIAFCVQNEIKGPGNVVFNGEDNHVKGRFNTLDGFSNFVNGNFNDIEGDSNNIDGDQNIVEGNDNLVFGSQNFVSGEGNLVSGMDHQNPRNKWAQTLRTEFDQKLQYFENQAQKLASQIKQKIIKKLEHKFSQQMKKQFQQRFNKQSKLNNIEFQKLRRMTAGKHQM